MKRERYNFVDLLRGLAALVVLIAHYRWFFARWPDDFRLDLAMPGQRFLWPIYGYGDLAVPLFWILSGFVFAVAYGRHGKGLSIASFWWRRFSRLYPLHFLTLLIVAGLQAASMAATGAWQVYGHNDALHFVLQLFFASNWLTMTSSFNGPIWSVSVEELIYFLFLLYMKRYGLKLAPALATVGLSFIIGQFTQSPIAQCGTLFFIGVATAMERRADMLVAGGAGLVIMAIVIAFSASDPHYLLVYLGCPSLLALFIGLDRRFALPRPFHWFGRSTYSIYLWHIPVVIALRLLGVLPPLWLFVSLVISIAYVSFRYIELPAQAWLMSLPLRRRSGRQVLGPSV